MISVNKLGQLALSKLAKKLGATVKDCGEEIPFDTFFRESKPSGEFSHLFMEVHYEVFLWDYEFGLLEIYSSLADLGTCIGLGLNARLEDTRKIESTPSHLAIYSYTCQEDEGRKKIETKELQTYRLNMEKLNEWFENY